MLAYNMLFVSCMETGGSHAWYAHDKPTGTISKINKQFHILQFRREASGEEEEDEMEMRRRAEIEEVREKKLELEKKYINVKMLNGQI